MIDREVEEMKTCIFCFVVGYFMFYIPIAAAAGFINLETLTLEDILFIIVFL